MLKALLQRICNYKHTKNGFYVTINVLAFLYVKANSKEICEEISFPSFFRKC